MNLLTVALADCLTQVLLSQVFLWWDCWSSFAVCVISFTFLSLSLPFMNNLVFPEIKADFTFFLMKESTKQGKCDLVFFFFFNAEINLSVVP